MNSAQLIYLNSFHNLNENEEGYQMSVNGPDSYFINYQKVKGQLKLQWKQRQGFNYIPNGRRNKKEMMPKRLENSIGQSRVFIAVRSVLGKSYNQTSHSKLFLIPYEIEDFFTTFAQITKNQYKFLKKMFIEKNGMFFSEYQANLQHLISENGTNLLKIFIISHTNNLAGDVVCICRSKFDLPKKYLY